MREFTENETYEKLREKVFFYVTFQKRTEAELRRNFLPLFKKYNISKDMYYDLVEELKEKGYVDDSEFIRKKFDSYIRFKICSVKEIEFKLLQKGVSKESIDFYKEENKELLYQHELTSAKILYEKKIAEKSDEDVRLYLRRKGYPEEIVKQI